MITILTFLAQLALTLVLAALMVGYLRPFLRRVLADLCGTEERAQFWTAFSGVLLIGTPLIFALNYQPKSGNLVTLFFEVVRKLSGNLGGLLFALVIIGFVVSFFALVAPKPAKLESK